ncbi:hypothetical protein F9802_04325 [Bacillus aerolatus]|uniref:YtkA-like domain-containing protein n=1 Tax=Bacillus aerolatus TaxID=2653354 RepID=A0A6I1FHR0_9BACI|nr:DUF6130 family protein [Bacillus aerolatus]KAB7707947.1 hypothetical protein F9802_04325 [Bacillus aerolatus]
MKWMIMIVTVIVLAGCKQNFPEPEAISPSASVSEAEAQANNNNWTVRHLLRGQSVFVELVVPGVSFSGNGTNSQTKGQVSVYVNGHHYNTYHTAAFIVKGLAPGKHQVDIKLTDARNRPLGYEKTFTVSIP